MSFWTDKIRPAEPELPRADRAAYQQHMAAISGSGIYRPSARPQARPEIYVPREQKQLQDYAGAARSKYLPRQGESDRDYAARLQPLLQHLAEELPEAELAQVAEEYNAAIERLEGGQQTHAALRQQLDSRQSGTGVGIMGASPTERAAMVGRHGGREIEGQGHRTVETIAASQPISAAQVNQILQQREAEPAQQPPQHTDVSSLRSSGEGWHIRG
jgi:hypothetical protein